MGRLKNFLNDHGHALPPDRPPQLSPALPQHKPSKVDTALTIFGTLGLSSSKPERRREAETLMALLTRDQMLKPTAPSDPGA